MIGQHPEHPRSIKYFMMVVTRLIVPSMELPGMGRDLLSEQVLSDSDSFIHHR